MKEPDNFFDKNQSQRHEYVRRINIVIDYIENNLCEELSLDKLSRIAMLSKFHFHRIFSALTGETLNHFVQRLRAEKAASKLIDNPGKTITDIAFESGFSGSAAFSRSFREAFGMTPREWRNGGYQERRNIRKQNSKNCKKLSKEWKDISIIPCHDKTIKNLTWRIKMKNKNEIKVEILNMPEFHVAYARHIGPYPEIGPTFEKILIWAGARELCKFPESKVLGVYHDDPQITEPSKLRSSACITVPKGTKAEGEIGIMDIPGGKYAVAHFELKMEEFPHAWNLMMGEWLPQSGYQPDDRPCYELYHNNCMEHPEKISIVDLCVPVKPR